MATISNKNEKCECGRDWQTLDRIDGRSGNMITKRDGTVISPAFFIHFFGVVHNKGFIKKYQVIQEDYEKFTLRIVLNENYDPENVIVRRNLNSLVNNIKKAVGSETIVTFDFCEDIPPLPSGKFMYTISKVSRKS